MLALRLLGSGLFFFFPLYLQFREQWMPCVRHNLYIGSTQHILAEFPFKKVIKNIKHSLSNNLVFYHFRLLISVILFSLDFYFLKCWSCSISLDQPLCSFYFLQHSFSSFHFLFVIFNTSFHFEFISNSPYFISEVDISSMFNHWNPILLYHYV